MIQRGKLNALLLFIALTALVLIWFLDAAGSDPSQPSFLEYLYNYRWEFARGTWMTVKISIAAMALAMTLGLILALCRLYAHPVIARCALAYIEFVRGTPLLVQLYFIYYGLPHLPLPAIFTAIGMPALASAADSALRLQAVNAAILGVGLNYAAYEAEIYRAGIMAVPRQQSEAAAALGLTKAQTVRLVVLPQALRLVVPPVTNDFVALFKDTSIVSIVAITELTKTFTNAGIATQHYLGFAVVTALIYFAISYPVSKFARHLERQIHPHHDFDNQPQ